MIKGQVYTQNLYTEEELLKNHVCMIPFKHMEMFKDKATLCCGTWLKKELVYPKDENGKYDYDVWNSEAAQEIRQSILDGKYTYCDKQICPHLNSLISTGITDRGIFVKRDDTDFPHYDFDNIKIDDDCYVKNTPGSLNFTFDWSCNFKCPSCRVDTIMAKSDEVKEIDGIVEFINKTYSANCKKILITGSGDPFASKSFRKFLFNFQPSQWPELKSVQLITNGKLFNEKNWNLMKAIQPYVVIVDVSIDAGTKDTYENKTRLGGHWETLLKNLKFISTIKSINFFRISFVVQNDNYKEMELALELVYDIFKHRITDDIDSKKVVMYFGYINQWQHLTDEDMMRMDVSNPKHINHKDFIKYIKKADKWRDRIHIQSNWNHLYTNIKN